MLRNRLYYHIKPVLSPHIRLGLRRWFAVRKRNHIGHSWPILPGSERPPQNWPGWPGGKKFALVLTHDVESQLGVDKSPGLMELEKSLGFRSSFNYIPEGGYRVSRELRDKLTQNGFEVGVHDLHHDGKLYHGRREFSARAARINEYLQDWGAVGFRSGFMLHNLEWLHDLNAAYDASTFDTDPFEPQPDGVGTIFPFWVPALQAPIKAATINQSPKLVRPGYVELPYTLPQDSTLFLLLRERHPDIWIQKLDWIAKHGGMALVNVHPDYLQFEGETASLRAFPVELYARFLQYARDRYGDSFWQPLPREMASFVAKTKPMRPVKPRRVCMVTYSYYREDSRVVRYAEALAERGDHVDVLSVRRSLDLPKHEVFGNVNLFRIQARLGKSEKSRLSFLLPILRFLVSSSIWIALQHKRKRYDLLHIHNVPDFLVFAGALPRLTGAKVVLDIHDIIPEFYGSKFGAREGSPTVTLLKQIERISARFADKVIMSNHLWLEKYRARTRANGKCCVFINNVDRHIFSPRPRTRKDEKFVILFPGGLQWHQGLDIAIRAFHKISAEQTHAEFHIYGDGNVKSDLVALVGELGLGGRVRFFDPLPVRSIADVMANADLGIVPKRANSFGNEAYSTKIMEFMSVGVPVVVSSTKIDRFYFDDSVVRFFESGNSDALAEAMLELIQNEGLRRSMALRASDYAEQNSWAVRKDEYLELVDSLIENRPAVQNIHPPDASFQSPAEHELVAHDD